MSTNEQVAEGTVLGGAGATSGTDRAQVVIVDGGRSIALPVTLGGGGAAIGTVNQGDPAVVAKAWPILVTDGVDTALVAVAAPGAADPGLVIRMVPAPGVDIGDVTVNNAAGASAVNVQDGGNSLTVDGTVTANQGTPAVAANAWPTYDATALTSTSPTRDAFSRLRVSAPQHLFASKQLANNQPLFWDDAVLSGAGTSSTYNSNQASTTLAVSNLTAGSRARQTFRSFQYTPGKSQLIDMTFVSTAPAAGITKRVGYYNTNNGVYFEQAGTTLQVVTRTFTSGVVANNAVTQANWNIDKLNGLGGAGNPSGINLDVTKTQILVIDFQWLGVGTVRFGFNINGILYYCHQFRNANNLSLVYMQIPSLPLRYEITNDGTGGVASLTHICSSVASEGGSVENSISLCVDRGGTVMSAANNTNIYPLVAIRLRSGYGFAEINPQQLSVLCATTAAYRWALYLNPTVVGVALAFTAVTNSAVEADVVSTSATTITGGTLILSGYTQSQATGEVVASLDSDLRLGVSIAGVSDVLVLAVQRITGGAEDYVGSLTWHEFQ